MAQPLPAVSGLLDRLNKVTGTGDPWKRSVVATAFVFGSLYVAASLGVSLAWPLALVILAGALLLQR